MGSSGNGASLFTPICGIGMVAAQNAVIEDNRIVDNGLRHPGDAHAFLPRGLRGGIVIWEATTVRAKANGKPTFPATIADLTLPETSKSYTTASGESAVIVRGNEVSRPLGKALWIRRGFGPITVTGNSFEGFGDPVTGVEIGTTAKARGTVIEIIDYAKAIEIDWSSVTDEIGELAWTDEAGGEVDGGGILFADNSVKSTWTVSHVQACAVFVCSFDQAAWLAESKGYYVFAVYVGGTSTASAVGNRIVHEKFGAVFSLVVGPPTVSSGGFHSFVRQGVMLSSNVGTHAFVGQVPVAGLTKRLNVNNISVFPVETAGVAFNVEIPDGSRDITVVFEP